MKKLFLMSLFASLLAFTACDDSASSGDSDGSDSKSTSKSKGSFPPNGDESFYCVVTDGRN